MRTRRWLALPVVLAAACSTAKGSATRQHSSAEPRPTPHALADTSREADAETSSEPSEVKDGASLSNEPPGLGCPKGWPAEWIVCEDFEDFGGWGDFWTRSGAMAVEPGPAISGESSLRISHNVGQYGSGMADIRFGSGPSGGVIYQPDAEYRDVWVRFFVRTHPRWPAGRGISEGIEVMSVIGENRSIAVDAAIYSASTAEARFLPWSCVHDSELRCSGGNGDWRGQDLRPLGETFGPTALYGDELAGQWQCHEMHVRLDDPGKANGVLEFWADGNLET